MQCDFCDDEEGTISLSYVKEDLTLMPLSVCPRCWRVGASLDPDCVTVRDHIIRDVSRQQLQRGDNLGSRGGWAITSYSSTLSASGVIGGEVTLHRVEHNCWRERFMIVPAVDLDISQGSVRAQQMNPELSNNQAWEVAMMALAQHLGSLPIDACEWEKVTPLHQYRRYNDMTYAAVRDIYRPRTDYDRLIDRPPRFP